MSKSVHETRHEAICDQATRSNLWRALSGEKSHVARASSGWRIQGRAPPRQSWVELWSCSAKLRSSPKAHHPSIRVLGPRRGSAVAHARHYGIMRLLCKGEHAIQWGFCVAAQRNESWIYPRVSVQPCVTISQLRGPGTWTRLPSSRMSRLAHKLMPSSLLSLLLLSLPLPVTPAVSHSTTFSVTVNTELGCAARPFRTGPPDIRPGHHGRPMPGAGAREGVQSDTTRRARRRVLHGGTHVIGESGRHQEPSSMLLHEGCALLAAGARKVVLLADCGSPHLRKRCAERWVGIKLPVLVWSGLRETVAEPHIFP